MAWLLLLSNTTVHPALHNTLIPNRDAVVMSSMMWPVSIVSKPGIMTLHMCVDVIFQPSGRVTVTGWVAHCLF
jgi:hypothetical protein